MLNEKNSIHNTTMNQVLKLSDKKLEQPSYTSTRNDKFSWNKWKNRKSPQINRSHEEEVSVIAELKNTSTTVKNSLRS